MDPNRNGKPGPMAATRASGGSSETEQKNNSKSNKAYEFVGPICESTDTFSTFKKFQKLKENDLVIICDVGAYGMSLSSNYNLRPKATEILIRNSKVQVISKRQNLKDLI